MLTRGDEERNRASLPRFRRADLMARPGAARELESAALCLDGWKVGREEEERMQGTMGLVQGHLRIGRRRPLLALPASDDYRLLTIFPATDRPFAVSR